MSMLLCANFKRYEHSMDGFGLLVGSKLMMRKGIDL